MSSSDSESSASEREQETHVVERGERHHLGPVPRPNTPVAQMQPLQHTERPGMIQDPRRDQPLPQQVVTPGQQQPQAQPQQVQLAFQGQQPGVVGFNNYAPVQQIPQQQLGQAFQQQLYAQPPQQVYAAPPLQQAYGQQPQLQYVQPHLQQGYAPAPLQQVDMTGQYAPQPSVHLQDPAWLMQQPVPSPQQVPTALPDTSSSSPSARAKAKYGPEYLRYLSMGSTAWRSQTDRDRAGYIELHAPLETTDKVSGFEFRFSGKDKYEPSRYDRLIRAIIPLIPRSLPDPVAHAFIADLMLAFDRERAFLQVLAATEFEIGAADEFRDTMLRAGDKPLRRSVRHFLKGRREQGQGKKKASGGGNKSDKYVLSTDVSLPVQCDRRGSRVVLNESTRTLEIRFEDLPSVVTRVQRVAEDAVSEPSDPSEPHPLKEDPSSDDSVDWEIGGGGKYRLVVGSMSRAWRGWMGAGASKTVCNILRYGAPLRLFATPPPSSHITPPSEEVLKEVEGMVQNGVIERVESAQVTVGLFLVNKPKAPGEYRPIVDMRYTNRYMERQRFRLMAFQALEALRPKGWPFMRVDLRKGYWQILIRPQDRQFTGIRVGGITYVHRALCFGASVAPITFQTVTEELARLVVREAGVGVVIVYLDDFLLLAPTERELLLLRRVFDRICERCGAVLALDKSDAEPRYRGVWLGTGVDTREGTFFVDPDKAASLLALLRPMVAAGSTTQGKLRSLLGKLTFCHRAYAPALVHTKLLLSLLSRGERDSTKVSFQPQHISRLHHWIRTLKGGASRSFMTPPFTAVITTDAATGEGDRPAGMGGQLRIGDTVLSFSEPFPDSHSGAHINVLEAKAILRAVTLWSPKLRGRGVIIRSDNSTAVHCINRGGSRAPRVQEVVEDIWQKAASIDCRFVARHVAGQLNVGADIASRFRILEGSTPEGVIQQLEVRWGTLEVDRFAALDNHRFRLFQTREEDALAWDWRGWRNFVAPPWAMLGEVVTAVAGWVRPIPFSQSPISESEDTLVPQHHLDSSVAVLLTPMWERQPWFAHLLRLAVDWVDLEVQDGGKWDRAVRQLYRRGEDNSPNALFSEGRIRHLVESKKGSMQGNSLSTLLSDIKRGAAALDVPLDLGGDYLKTVVRQANDALPMKAPKEKHAYSVFIVQTLVTRLVAEAGGVEAAAQSTAGSLAVMATMALGTAGRVGDLLKLQEDCVVQVGARDIRYILTGRRSAKADRSHGGEVACMQFPVWGEVDTWVLFHSLWRAAPKGGLIFKRRGRKERGGVELTDSSQSWADALTLAARRVGVFSQKQRIQ
ncbi:hypothetical protein KIPB_009533, partial [Kipferlia bialata]|eukprot:g9533.t1